MSNATQINQIPIFVINLDRSPERLESIKMTFKSLGLEFIRVRGVDLNTESDPGKISLYDDYQNSKRYFAKLSKAEQGCFYSHRNAWKAFLNSTSNTCIVLEDDVALTNDFSDAVAACCHWLVSERPRILKLYSKRPVRGISAYLRDSRRRIVIPKLPPLGAVAHIINRPAAKELLARSDSFFQPVDVYMQAWWQTGVEVGVLQPSIVNEVSVKLGGSTIQNRKPIPAPERIKREVLRGMFRFKLYCKACAQYRNYRNQRNESESAP